MDENKYEFFWWQYHGRVKAADLPLWYIKEDTRITCCNNECHIKEKCALYARFIETCKVFHEKPKAAEKAAKRDLRGWERPEWDKFYPQPDYRSGSFTLCPEQNGVTCEYLIEK